MNQIKYYEFFGGPYSFFESHQWSQISHLLSWIDFLQVVGTYGYAAPDYIKSGHLTIKSDVWSFGVVLYEMLTGRRTLDKTRPKPEQKLLDWVKKFPIESKRFSEIMDPKLRNEYSISAARLLANLANSCLLKNPKDRPSMCEVVEALAQAIQVTTDAGPPTGNH